MMTSTGMCRENAIRRIEDRTKPWDIVVIGGGATGIAVALDAAARELDVLLLERADFGQGTSSRSTKLVHGGVRYLKQGNITLVRDALRERTLLRNNAPHLVHDLQFLIPCRGLWERFFYGTGMKAYDFLASSQNFGRSRRVSTAEALVQAPALRKDKVRGAVLYHDGQFDDARLLINMARTAHDQGACLLNYMPVTNINKTLDGSISGVAATDRETGENYDIDANCVINAAGPFCDHVRRLDDGDAEPMLAHSQGVHLVLPKHFFPGETAVIVPKTPDGRVVFIIPWHGRVLVGTTDTPIPDAVPEPSAKAEEIQFLLAMAAEYLTKPPQLSDVLSVFTGIRPLVKGDKSARTASLSRDHAIRVSTAGLITITGGKWTTVREMAEACVDRATQEANLGATACMTKDLRLHGHTESTTNGNPRAFYGSDLVAIEQLESDNAALAVPMCESLSIRKSDVVWAVRHEMARTVEDVLARRTRCILLDCTAAARVAPEVAQVMAGELGYDESWCREQEVEFEKIAANYNPQNGAT
ncbi:MAG: glycerol-3-phosphate dehydrogenase/oxidase [Aureliella sp.]